MPSIQQSPYPLVYPFDHEQHSHFSPSPSSTNDSLNFRVYTRSLEGMQKEALVSQSNSDRVWRMVCDEGPYLNGTDLAPFPLAFFTTGMVSSFMSEILALLKSKNILFDSISLTQDNQYSMEGSAIKGTMTGSALPVELSLDIDTQASPELLKQVLIEAVIASPAGALLKNILESQFSLTLNGRAVSPKRVAQTSRTPPLCPKGFDLLEPSKSIKFSDDIIFKNKTTETVFNVAGGAGTSLQDDQKRILHVRGVCTIREDGLKDIQVQLFKPIGSMFRFVSDDSEICNGQSRAPSGLAYLSAGLAFCYMTQIGRYAHIVKKPLNAYHIIQDTCFSMPGSSCNTQKPASMETVNTHVYIDSSDDENFAQTIVDMSEQTCFLHAACRSSVKVKLKG